MHANLKTSLALIFDHEGGYVDHPDDPGGCTNRGITLKTYRLHIDPKANCADLRRMPPSVAERIYTRTYWRRVNGDGLPPGIDLSVFDFGVNAGPVRACKLVQKLAGVTRDGIVGPHTLSALWASDREKLIRDYAAARLAYYRRLRHWKTFGRGWARRTDATLVRALELHALHEKPAAEA